MSWLDFIIVGAQKGGTTALSVNLSKHPQIAIDENLRYNQKFTFLITMPFLRIINPVKSAKYHQSRSIFFSTLF